MVLISESLANQDQKTSCTSRYLSKLNVNEVFSAIREAVALHHALQVYAIALIKPASILKTSSGKIQRHACRHAFLTETLAIVGQWRQNQL
jgi:acyl-CoA synthetase (AMP-forming)/AMP-acid ligase II